MTAMNDFVARVDPPVWTAHLGGNMRPLRTVTIVRGSTAPIDVTVGNRDGVILLNQVVEFSFDKANWLTAGWIGPAGTTRTARLQLTPATTPTGPSKPIYVRLTAGSATPWLRAGSLIVED